MYEFILWLALWLLVGAEVFILGMRYEGNKEPWQYSDSEMLDWALCCIIWPLCLVAIIATSCKGVLTKKRSWTKYSDGDFI